jgi:hypothetical protein
MAVRPGLPLSARALLLTAALLIVFGPAPLRAQEVSEFELKAVFLYRFAGFVDWPVQDEAGRDRPFTVGVVGTDPFGTALDAIAARSVAGRPIEVLRFAGLDEIVPTDILYVSASEDRRLGQVISSVEGRPTLTVGDAPGFLDAGGMIRFVTRDRRIHLEINRCATDVEGFRINARLLQVADRVVDACGAAR